MALTTGPVSLVAGTRAALAQPDSAPWETAVITNLSPFTLLLIIGANQYWMDPWEAARFDTTGTAAPIAALPAIPIGASVIAGTSSQLYGTWYRPGEHIPGTYPISLSANAVATALAGQVAVVNGNPSPLQVGGTVTANQGGAPWSDDVTDRAARLLGHINAIDNALPAGANIIGALSANQSVNVAQVAGTATSTGTGVVDAGTQRVMPATPLTANILVGTVAQTATTAAATVITIPANRKWTGTITVSCDVANGATSTAVGQALATIATAGASVTPAAGTVFTVEARCGANAATGLTGSQGNNSASIPIEIDAGGNAATITLASTQAGTNSRVSATASGVLT